ncbi:hypothetical protein GCM10023238_36740 [Streptomyces heliomycini]
MFTTVVVGLMVGVEFSVAFVMNPIFNALPEDSGQLGRAHGGRMLGAVMPFWYLGSLVLAAIWPSPAGTTTAPASSSSPPGC